MSVAFYGRTHRSKYCDDKIDDQKHRENRALFKLIHLFLSRNGQAHPLHQYQQKERRYSLVRVRLPEVSLLASAFPSAVLSSLLSSLLPSLLLPSLLPFSPPPFSPSPFSPPPFSPPLFLPLLSFLPFSSPLLLRDKPAKSSYLLLFKR